MDDDGFIGTRRADGLEVRRNASGIWEIWEDGATSGLDHCPCCAKKLPSETLAKRVANAFLPLPAGIRYGALDMQVCVPRLWTDSQVVAFAEKDNPSGSSHGWQIRREGDAMLGGADERVQCPDRLMCVHVTLDV